MSWPYKRRRRTRKSDESGPFDMDEFFDDDDWFPKFDFPFKRIDRLIESMFEAIGSSSSIDASMTPDSESMPRSLYYGYQVTVGPDGKPHVREFGNVKPTRSGRFEVGSREPFVDTIIDEKENTLKIVAEMPGLQKEDIKLELTEDSLKIEGANGGRKYETTIPLKVPVINESAKASYNNGVLEVKLPIKESYRRSGVSIKVN